MSYDEAQSELRRLIDHGLSAGLDDSSRVPKSDVYEAACGETDELQYYPTYQYEFPLEILGPDPDAFAKKVANYWESQDFELTPDDADSMIRGSYAVDGEFHLQVYINRRTGNAVIGGSGPCVSKPAQ